MSITRRELEWPETQSRWEYQRRGGNAKNGCRQPAIVIADHKHASMGK